MYMIFYFLMINSLAIREESTPGFLTLERNYLVVTKDVRRAVDFEFVTADRNHYFYLLVPGTTLALDSQIAIKGEPSKVFVSQFRKSPSQKWKFVFNRHGGLSMISDGQKMIRIPGSGYFTMVPIGKYKEYPGFVLFDVTMTYFDKFLIPPLANIESAGIGMRN